MVKKALEIIIEGFGLNGRYQKCQYITILSTLFVSVWQMFVYIFIARPVEQTCTPVSSAALDQLFGVPPGTLEQTDVEYSACSVDLVTDVNNPTTTSVKCPAGYDYERDTYTSIVSEWDLVCDKLVVGCLTQTVFIAAQGVGSVFFTCLSDRLGRKPILISVLALTLFWSVGVGFASSLPSFVVIRSIIGSVSDGAYLISITLVVELSIPDNRLNINVLFALGWAIAAITFTPVGYLLQYSSWRTIQFVSSAAGIIVLLQLWVVDESIRWLVSHRRFKDAIHLMRKVSRINKVDLCAIVAKIPDNKVTEDNCERVESDSRPDSVEVIRNENETGPYDFEPAINSRDVSIETANEPGENTQPNRVDTSPTTVIPLTEVGVVANSTGDCVSSCSDEVILAKLKKRNKNKLSTVCSMIASRHICVNMVVLWFIWLFNSLAYYLVFYTGKSLSSNLYLTFLLATLAEFPAILFVWLSLDRIGRRLSLVVFGLIAAVALIVATLLKHFLAGNLTAEIMAIIIGFIGKVGLSASVYAIIFFTVELYPTPIRNIGIGSSALFGRVGGMCATFGNILHDNWPWSVGCIAGVLSLMIALLVLLLPETMKKPLPQTVEDVNNLYDKNSKCKCC